MPADIESAAGFHSGVRQHGCVGRLAGQLCRPCSILEHDALGKRLSRDHAAPFPTPPCVVGRNKPPIKTSN
jgi:hypothetical protein